MMKKVLIFTQLKQDTKVKRSIKNGFKPAICNHVKRSANIDPAAGKLSKSLNNSQSQFAENLIHAEFILYYHFKEESRIQNETEAKTFLKKLQRAY